MSHLPWDFQEEILSRIPLTSLRSVRSTCKKWNTLSKDGSFTKKHLAREGEFVAVVTINYSIYLMSIDLYGIHNNSEPSIKPTGKLITLNDSDEVGISQLCHCEGLLLCTTKDYTRLVVWNPYSGQTVCVKPTSVHHRPCWYGHALGYDKSKSCRTHKILRSAHPSGGTCVHKIYDLNSNSWRVLDVTPDCPIDYDNNGRSLKGNTYWIAPDKESEEDDLLDFLLCFDFTTERFGPRLPLPFMVCYDDTAILSSLREEQLAVSVQRWENCVLEIWVTTKIEPNAVSGRCRGASSLLLT